MEKKKHCRRLSTIVEKEENNGGSDDFTWKESSL